MSFSQTFTLFGVHSQLQSLRTFLKYVCIENAWWCVRAQQLATYNYKVLYGFFSVCVLMNYNIKEQSTHYKCVCRLFSYNIIYNYKGCRTVEWILMNFDTNVPKIGPHISINITVGQ